MDKISADKLIIEYKDKIFGFALEAMRNIDRAQELASDIVAEVYSSFLRADNIVNPNGYVYRIARNVLSQYFRRLETGRRFESLDEAITAAPADTDKEEQAMIGSLRKEIGYLSDRQRLVVYMHYYSKLSVAEIASKLNISAGTVKWHLSDARSKLKEGIDMNIMEQDLEMNPIIFTNMGHSGSAGNKGDTADIFDTRLKMNIAWACYWEALTLEEIARAVGVPQVYVADNLAQLVDFAFIDKLDNSKNPKYRTNMYLTDIRTESDTIGPKLDEAVELMCEKYIPQILADFEASSDHWGLTCDGDDVNYMKYSIIPATLEALCLTDVSEEYDRLCSKRPDGGSFIAMAEVSDDSHARQNETPYKYWTCGAMTRGGNSDDDPKGHWNAISIDCIYSDRTGGWRDNLGTDWESLAKFIRLGKDSLAPEQYKRLCDKGYLYEDRVQPIIVRTNSQESKGRYIDFISGYSFNVPEELLELSRRIDAEQYEHEKKLYPEHIHGIVKLWNTNIIGGSHLTPRVVEKLLNKGLLAPLTDVQKKSVFSVMCIEE